MIGAIISALSIGILLSVLGSGGSIFTVPILLYIIEMTPQMAIASSLAVVGLISLFSTYRYYSHQQISWRFVMLFGLPGMAGTYSGAWLGTQISSTLQLGIFVGLMLVAAFFMFRKNKTQVLDTNPEAVPSLPKTGTPTKTVFSLAQGFGVGVITGVVGVGGGFLIVPALVLFARLKILTAIGTSLVIITINSAVGFYKYYTTYSAPHFSEQGLVFDWQIILILAGGGILGSLLGNQISKRIATDKLQQIFAGFLVIMAGFMLVKSLL